MDNKKISISILFSFLFFCLTVTPTYAAIMELKPQSGNFSVNKPFSVDLVLDGQNESLNAAKASLSLSSNLTVTNLTLGDCGFSFVTTPSVMDPTFAGVILGGSTKKCTVYSLSLTPTALGDASIRLTGNQIKRFPDAADILTTSRDGLYTITNPSLVDTLFKTTNTTTQNTITPPPDSTSGYSLTITVVGEDDKPVSGASVLLEPQAAGATPQQTATDANGKVTFTNLPESVYTVTSTNKGKVIGKQIMNVGGQQPTLTLSMQQKKQSFPIVPLILASILIIIGGIAAFALLRKRGLNIPNRS